MMKKLVYILINIVFLNLSVWLLYYLGLVNNTSLIIFDNSLDILITNVTAVSIYGFYILIYRKVLIHKFNYWKIAVLGLVVGLLIVFLLKSITFQEKLFLVLFSSFSLTFLSYSIYFEEIKENVFR